MDFKFLNFNITIKNNSEIENNSEFELLKKKLDELGYRIVKKTNDTSNKKISAQKANLVKSQKTKKKIFDCIEELKMDTNVSKITHNLIKSKSGVSYQSVKKYVSRQLIDDLNS